MSTWNFEPGEEEEPPQILFRALRALRSIARSVAPDLRIEHRERRHREFDREIRALLGDRGMPFFEGSDQVYVYVDLLNRVLGKAKAQDSTSAPPTGAVGTSRTVIAAWLFAGRKPIHLGTVERYLIYPASPALNAELLRLVVTSPEMDDVLIREQHDVFGWHYHYCDQRQRRSDILMSFDRKRAVKSASVNPQQSPLCWEPHAINKAKFKAKPSLWGARKRESIYTACTPDLGIMPALTFKPPSKEAEDVWPIA